MIEDEDIEQRLDQHRIINDRFTFDDLFRWLLRLGYDHEECKETILANCSLSTLVFQERIENDYYLSISKDEKLSSDLRKLRDEYFATFSPPESKN